MVRKGTKRSIKKASEELEVADQEEIVAVDPPNSPQAPSTRQRDGKDPNNPVRIYADGMYQSVVRCLGILPLLIFSDLRSLFEQEEERTTTRSRQAWRTNHVYRLERLEKLHRLIMTVS